MIEELFKKRQNKRSSLSTVLILDIKYKSNGSLFLSVCYVSKITESIVMEFGK